jgi:hypothetical protein
VRRPALKGRHGHEQDAVTIFEWKRCFNQTESFKLPVRTELEIAWFVVGENGIVSASLLVICPAPAFTEDCCMSLYWIYDLSNWVLCGMIVSGFVALALIGLYASRPIVGWLVGRSSKHNDIVSFFFAGMGVFYGLALGLIAVATWENFTAIDGVVSTEAAAVASFYRDLDSYPQPLRGQLETLMRDYTRTVIELEWPAHKRGDALEDADAILDSLENILMAFEPTKEREKISHATVLRSWDTLVEQRRLRLQAVSTGLPSALWAVVLTGAVVNCVLTYLFWVENLLLHAILVGLMATFVALLVFLTAAMDNPFRGEFSVSPDALQTILNKVMISSGPPSTSK